MALTTTTPTAPITGKRQAGRPTAAGSAARGDIILDAAIALFLEHGFAGTSIERVASVAGVSKRTLYARFPGKTELFQFAVERLIDTWRTEAPELDIVTTTLADGLRGLARPIVRVGLCAEALALYRLVVSEAGRFPELSGALNRGGSRMGIERVGAVIARHCPALSPARCAALAERFIDMLLSVPRTRALGLGEPFDEAALEAWAQETVTMFCTSIESK